ncbi:MAG: TraB/GumN family protein [Parvularculaceae bacterium]
MKQPLLPLAAAFAAFAAAPANAQAPAMSEQEAIAEIAAEAGPATLAMWRVADADSEFILLGTYHILPPSLVWRTAALDAAFKDATDIYFEVDAGSPDASAQTLHVIMTRGFNPPGVTLSSMLGEADASKLREVARDAQMPFAAIDTMRPWNAFLTLSVQFIISKGFDPGAGADSVLLAEAKRTGKKVHFFETLDEQLSLFTDLPPAVEKDLLVLTLRDWDNQEASFDELFKAWTQGDVEVIDRQMNQEMREQTPEVYKRIIADRNRAWAERLDADLKNGAGKAFVAVGAGHLVGDEFSVPALLAAKGYEVTRYALPAETAPEAAPEAANDNAPADDQQPH